MIAASRPARWMPYGLAVLTVLLAWGGTLLLERFLPNRPFSLVLFFAAVTLSAGVGGLRAGALATFLSALACDYFFLTPYHSFAIAEGDLPLLLLFLVVALLINGLSERLRAETRQADRRFYRLQNEFAILNAITAAVSESLELPELLHILRKQLQEHLDITGGCVYLAGEEGETLRLLETWGAPTTYLEGWQALPQEALPRLPAKEGTQETRTDGVLRLPVPEEMQKLGWKEALTIPLIANEELWGCLCLFSKVSFEQRGEPLAFFAALGRQIGTLLQNATFFQEVHAGRERLHHLSRQLVNVQEAERRAIARELHDEIGQILTGLKLSLEMGARLPPAAAAGQAQEALKLVQELMRQVEALSLDLRPAMLDDLGLLPALLWHCERYTALTGIQVHLNHSGLDRRFSSEVEITAYRIVQESLTNVARYAGVSEVAVRLWSTRDTLGLQVADQGRGFDTATARNGKAGGGLTGMQERAALLDGRWSVETEPGMGTCITVELPLNRPASEETTAGDVLLAARKHEE